MLKLLVKKQLTEIFRAYIYDAKKNRARSKAATVGYIIFFVLLMVGVIGGMFTTLSLAMCRSMAEAGMSWFYFAIMGLMAILLGAFGSVFTTYSSLYLPKDNDQMLSLPIPVNTLIAAPSVSLEGKQLWLAQSLPVSPWQVLRAKLRLQLLITIPPMLLCLVCLLAVYPGSPLELLFIAVTALSYALLMALLGLFLGLKMPNLSWTNEVVPIKQSACVALSLFGGWAMAMIPGALYLLTGIGSLDPLLYLSVVTALLLILSAVLSLWVKKTGSRIFAAL